MALGKVTGTFRIDIGYTTITDEFLMARDIPPYFKSVKLLSLFHAEI